MDGNGRNIVSFNRFFSAQEIVKSNDENGVPHNQTSDGGASSQYGQYGGRNHSVGGPRNEFHQFDTSSNLASMCGGPSSQYGQYDGRNNHEIDGSANTHAYQSSSNNAAVFGSFSNQYGHNVGHHIQNIGSPMNAFHQFRSSTNNAGGGSQYWQASSSNPTFSSNHYMQHDGLNNRNIGGSVNTNAFQSSNNAAVFGGPSSQYEHYGGFNNHYGGQLNALHQYHSPTSSNNSANIGGISNQCWQYDGRNNSNIGGSVNRHAFQSSPKSAVFGGSYSQYGDFDVGNVSYPSEARRFSPSSDEGTRFNSQYGLYNNRGPAKTVMHPTVNQTSQGGDPSHNSHVNMNAASERFFDTSSRNEHAKLKIKIVEAFKDKASKPFSENSARFNEDEWLKVWYILSNGLRSYQCQMTCPICYKKLTPQNRSEPGSLPRWDLTIVKGHLERLHSTKILRETAADNEDHIKTKEKEEGQRKNEKTENAEKGKETNKEEGQNPIKKPNTITTESLDLMSSPESFRQSTSSSSSDDEPRSPSSSASNHTTVSTAKKRRVYTRKQSNKRGKLALDSESDEMNPHVAEFVVSNMRNLMKYSLKHILRTFSDHEKILQEVYNEFLTKRRYKPKDLPDLLAHDIMNDAQLGAMAQLAELKLAKEEHHNSTDVIFDAILPEWALAEFCKEFNLTRSEAVQVIKNQNEALINQSE